MLWSVYGQRILYVVACLWSGNTVCCGLVVWKYCMLWFVCSLFVVWEYCMLWSVCGLFVVCLWSVCGLRILYVVVCLWSENTVCCGLFVV